MSVVEDAMPAPPVEAVTVRITGVVQGVGFRPFVHRLALRYLLAGWVRNQAGEVQVLAEGTREAIDLFLSALRSEAPPLARIDAIESAPATSQGSTGFRIAESEDQPDRRQPVSPDVALCPKCERELLDPENRRHRYPFITCTDCGPRFTVIEAMPYDRERTSMRRFQQCEACLAEYRTPDHRRYHSETNSCPRCGPRVWVEVVAEASPPGEAAPDPPPAVEIRSNEGSTAPPSLPDPIASAAAALKAGKIVGIRGLGGFHLAADATNEEAVRRLRLRKAREAKPLAVMVRTVEEARGLGKIGSAEVALLTSAERPIVLLDACPGSPLAPSVAPGLGTVGTMTPYTPLHHLLLSEVGRPLVMTSGNRMDEPIATGNAEARRRLAGIADLLLLHNREIVARYDDSVVRPTRQGTVFLRRARGYAPLPLRLPLPATRPLVAVGPHLKSTFTLVHGKEAFVSQHIGDLENLETLEHFRTSLALFKRLFRIEPKTVVRDLHPGYLSTRIAEEMDLGKPIAVQHHHAHVAAVAAEHGVTDPVVGIAYDGTGYGDDGAVWGAEILVADLTTYRRIAQLRYAPLPGGDLAVRSPWRVALGYASLEPSATSAFRRAWSGIPETEVGVANRQIAGGLNAPIASSMGRLFDAAAAVLGTRSVCHYEGQAAMELESLAGSHAGITLPFPVLPGEDDGWILDPVPLLAALAERRANGDPVETLAAGFHDAVASATVEVARRVGEQYGIRRMALGGGVFQNARLIHTTALGLSKAGFQVLLPRALSPNDGAISFGQAAVAAAVLQSRASE